MKYVIRILLIAIIGFLAYRAYNSIAEPVRYEKEVYKVETAVIEKLKVINEAQLAIKEVEGHFTASFDTLIDFMHNGQFSVLVAFGDQDDSTTVYRTETMNVSVKDSLFKEVDIDNIRFVPGRDTLQFLMEVGEVEKNGVMLQTFQVTDPEPFSKIRQKEKDPLRVGDIYDAVYGGNWGNR